jgi:hypothetical protein
MAQLSKFAEPVQRAAILSRRIKARHRLIGWLLPRQRCSQRRCGLLAQLLAHQGHDLVGCLHRREVSRRAAPCDRPGDRPAWPQAASPGSRPTAGPARAPGRGRRRDRHAPAIDTARSDQGANLPFAQFNVLPSSRVASIAGISAGSSSRLARAAPSAAAASSPSSWRTFASTSSVDCRLAKSPGAPLSLRSTSNPTSLARSCVASIAAEGCPKSRASCRSAARSSSSV